MASFRQASVLLAIVLFAGVASFADARALKQASPPYVTADQLTDAIQRIDKWAGVPDVAPAVARSPNYANVVASNQQAAAAIVQAANDFTNPSGWSQAAQEQSTALWSFGYQTGVAQLSPIGTRLYYAYGNITSALGFTQ